MNIDKFLTDLAQCTGCDCVGARLIIGGFQVLLSKCDDVSGWETFTGEGSTVDEAMANARAKMLDHYEVVA